MRITIFGAGGEVTGSAYLVACGKSKVLVDCGLFQGVPDSDRKNRISQQFTFQNLNSVLITHAHLDHTGRLPILAQRQFTGSVYSTEATAELTALILRDAARIQESGPTDPTITRRLFGLSKHLFSSSVICPFRIGV